MSHHLSDLDLDALRLGAGGPEAHTHVQACDVCQARQSTLTREAEDFAQRFNPAGLAAQTLAELPTQRPWWRRLTWLAAPLAAAAAVVFLVVIPDAPQLRTKGGPSPVEVFIVTAQGPKPMPATVAPDARLGVRLNPGQARQVRLLWGSRAGQWQALYPAADAPSWHTKGPTWLSQEVVLDGETAPEKLGVVFCETRVSHKQALELLRAGTGPGCKVHTVDVVKQ